MTLTCTAILEVLRCCDHERHRHAQLSRNLEWRSSDSTPACILQDDNADTGAKALIVLTYRGPVVATVSAWRCWRNWRFRRPRCFDIVWSHLLTIVLTRTVPSSDCYPNRDDAIFRLFSRSGRCHLLIVVLIKPRGQKAASPAQAEILRTLHGLDHDTVFLLLILRTLHGLDQDTVFLLLTLRTLHGLDPLWRPHQSVRFPQRLASLAAVPNRLRSHRWSEITTRATSVVSYTDDGASFQQPELHLRYFILVSHNDQSCNSYHFQAVYVWIILGRHTSCSLIPILASPGLYADCTDCLGCCGFDLTLLHVQPRGRGAAQV